MHVLQDQDGCLADWGLRWNEYLSAYGQKAVGIPRHEDQKTFHLKEGLNESQLVIVDEIFNHRGFYRDLEPIEGAIEGYRKMEEAGHHVQIVTSPWWDNPSCLQDKADWVEKYLGADARRNMVLTGDKTTVRGDYLIDDKPLISGKYLPDWEHVVFTQPYNLETVSRFRLNGWVDIDEVLARMEDAIYSFVTAQ